jgi:zinc transport system substrate-binding protein
MVIMRIPLALAVLLATGLSGCAAFTDGSTSAHEVTGGTVTVTASFYPLQYVAERVGGDHVDVTNLTQPGQEPHDLELTPRQTAELQDANLVVYEKGLQPQVDDTVAAVAGGTVVDAADVVHLLPMDENDAEHSADSTEDHDSHELDPHFWQDPKRMVELTDAVEAALVKIDPDHRSDYEANAKALDADLTRLASDYQTGLADCRIHSIVVSHDAWGYLAPYGLQVNGIAGLSPDAEPTAADLAHLQELIKSDGITTVFGERLVSPKLSEQLAKDMGVTTAVLDPIEGLTDETSDEDYLSLMRENLAALEKANGCA